ncbi:MAG: hypothetical protein Q9194_007012 [Teloschistes cf. exilis]
MDKLTASLLRQILQERPSSVTEIESLYKKHVQKKTRPTLSELQDALVTLSNQIPRVFILIDAVDECTIPGVRSAFLRQVIALQSQRKISVFVTSRFLPEITSLSQSRLSIEVRATEGDVKRYLENHMAESPKCIQRNDELQRTVVSEITKAVDGMFLLAQLHLASLSGKTTTKAVKLALQKLLEGLDVLDAAYKDALGRIEEQKPAMHQLAKNVLHWIVYAARQMTVSELQEALAVEEGTSELDEEDKPDLDDMISVCVGLVTVDEDSNVIRLVHHTTQEFLENLPAFKVFDHYVDANDIDRNTIDAVYENVCRNHVFFDYAGRSWYTHAESCWNEDIEAQVLDFIEEERQIIIGYSVYYDNQNPWLREMYEPYPLTGFQAIHWAVWIGSEKIGLALLGRGYDPQVLDDLGRTPLMYAAYGENEAVIKMLLDTPAMDVNIADKKGYTPPYFSAMKGHESFVRLLLEQKNIDVNPVAFNGNTPLLAACQFPRDTVVRLLTSVSHLDVNCVGEGGVGALHRVCAYGEGAIVKILLERKDILVNISINGVLDKEGGGKCPPKWYYDCTPLMVAARYGNEDTVRLLLKRGGVDMSCRNVDGDTALMLAYKRGYESTVNLLEDAGAEGEIPAIELRDYSPDGISKRASKI